jgi:hypothetical protein
LRQNEGLFEAFYGQMKMQTAIQVAQRKTCKRGDDGYAPNKKAQGGVTNRLRKEDKVWLSGFTFLSL